MFSFALSATSPPQPPSDSSVTAVVALARAGDQAAFTALFHQYNAPLCRYLAHLVGNDEVARDLAQETFFRAWQSLPTMRDEQRFAPWLYKIATNLARSYQRHARLVRWLPWVESDGEQTRQVPGPERQVVEAELVALALARLTPKYRVCLLLQLEGGFSQREIAQLLHLTEKSVSVYVSRGRQQFLQAYQELEQEMPAQRKGGPNS
ncbi:MAG TPA: RNA polymerase sigma factor [Ktedonobacterales bacterium]